MKKILLMITLFSSIYCVGCAKSSTEDSQQKKDDGGQEQTVFTGALCNDNATAEAKKVYSVLCQQYGKKTITGVMASVDWNSKEADYVNEWTGKYPALNGFDFINMANSKDVNPSGWLDYSDVTPVVSWWEQGGLVSCMWHWQVKANDGVNLTCTPGTEAGQTSFDPTCIENTASPNYKQLMSDLAQVAGYLKKLQDARVPVIWRPLHEGAGNTYEYKGGAAWFWWGSKGAEAYKKLWRFMYDYLVNQKGLNNLIWVWNSQMGDETWYPGDDVVDVVGRDSYYALQYPLWKNYTSLKETYPKKLVALAECGNGDSVDMDLFSDIWQQGSRWSWFMTWYDSKYVKGSADHRYAGKEWWQNAMNSGYVIDRSEMKTLLGK